MCDEDIQDRSCMHGIQLHDPPTQLSVQAPQREAPLDAYLCLAFGTSKILQVRVLLIPLRTAWLARLAELAAVNWAFFVDEVVRADEDCQLES